MDSVRAGPFGQLFRPDNFVFGQTGAGNRERFGVNGGRWVLWTWIVMGEEVWRCLETRTVTGTYTVVALQATRAA